MDFRFVLALGTIIALSGKALAQGYSGEPQTKVFDAMRAGDRMLGLDGKLPPVGRTVNGANFRNTIGAALLVAHWVDPKFDPTQRAYYYVLVLEIPTPRWTTYDAAFYGIDLPDGVPAAQQERAYTSPIWYSP